MSLSSSKISIYKSVRTTELLQKIENYTFFWILFIAICHLLKCNFPPIYNCRLWVYCVVLYIISAVSCYLLYQVRSSSLAFVTYLIFSCSLCLGTFLIHVLFL
jgi:hypothetical protein